MYIAHIDPDCNVDCCLPLPLSCFAEALAISSIEQVRC